MRKENTTIGRYGKNAAQSHRARGHIVKLYVTVMAFIFGISLSTALAQTTCTIHDDEEYAVLGAVLFPNEPDVPEHVKPGLEREAYLSTARVHLNGFHSQSYTIQDETTVGSGDHSEEDFGLKNKIPCRLDKDKLMAHMPPGRHVTLVSAAEVEGDFDNSLEEGGGWEKFRKKHPFAGGISYVSRPGFNKTKTEAVVSVHHQADYRMGVGYRVFLKKSPKTGKWFIDGASMTRIS